MMLYGVADRPISIWRVEAVLSSLPEEEEEEEEEEEDCMRTVRSSSVAAVSKKD